jgi:hypothetical protein
VRRGAVGVGVRDLKLGELTLSMGQRGQKFVATYKEPPFHLKGLSLHKYTCIIPDMPKLIISVSFGK